MFRIFVEVFIYPTCTIVCSLRKCKPLNQWLDSNLAGSSDFHESKGNQTLFEPLPAIPHMLVEAWEISVFA